MLGNFFIGGVIGIIYYLIICQISHNIYFENKEYNAQQKYILFVYFGGLVGLFLGSNKLDNSALRVGLYFGSVMLVFNAMIINWQNMNAQTKLLLLGINLGLVIWYSYYKNKNNKKKLQSSR